MIQFWREIECHVLCVMVFMIACKYLRLRKLMYKASPIGKKNINENKDSDHNAILKRNLLVTAYD